MEKMNAVWILFRFSLTEWKLQTGVLVQALVSGKVMVTKTLWLKLGRDHVFGK